MKGTKSLWIGTKRKPKHGNSNRNKGAYNSFKKAIMDFPLSAGKGFLKGR